MTFSVVVMENEHPKVVGTVWAASESQANAMAPAVIPEANRASMSIRRVEEREIPLLICDRTPMPCFG